MSTSPIGPRQELHPPSGPVGAGGYGLSLEDALRIIWRWSWAIVLVIVLLVGATVGYGLAQTPWYEASIKMLIGQKQGEAPESLGGEIPGLQQLTMTMAETVSTRTVAEDVIQKLNLRESPEEFLENLNVEQIGSTQLIEISYRDTDPERARQIADTIGKVFSQRVSVLSPSANAITATVVERAAAPEDPVSPDLLRYALLALAVGLGLGVGLAFLLEYADDSWRSPDEAEQISGVPTFGIIPRFTVPKTKQKG